MSADEIRRLAADALSNGIKIRDELLKHAAMVKERDELKAKLEQERMNKCDEVTAKRLAAAERCIDDCERDLGASLVLDDEYSYAAKSALAIIRAYREKKEAK